MLYRILCIILVVTALSCSAQKPIHNLNLATNRNMVLGIRKMTLNGVPILQDNNFKELRDKLVELSTNALREAYGSQISYIDFKGDNLLESPENIYLIGSKKTDDLFIADIDLSGNLDAQTLTKFPSPKATVDLGNAQFLFTIYNGANLKTVNLFKFTVPVKDSNSTFTTDLNATLKKAATEIFGNPNIYPRSDARHYADLLYIFSQQREKEAGVDITCENAPEVFKFYGKAEELYTTALAEASTRAVGQQQEISQINQRQADSAQKANVLKDCAEDSKKTFEITSDFGSISAENQAAILKAFATAGLDEILRKYTDRPVKFQYRVETNGDLSLLIELRFDRNRYQAWIKDKVPMKFRNFQILALDPYRALMQKLVVFKSSLPKTAASTLLTGFQNLRITLKLKTLLNGELSFGVDGHYIADRNVVQMAYPNSVVVQAPGFESKTISTKNNEVFQEKAWIALGNCKTIEGTITEDGLVYRFFGFPCQ